jgi:rubrerythrin
VFRDMIKYAETTGDETMRQAIDYVLADELTHVRFGSDWVREFTRDDPERFERAQEFRRQVDKQFSFGGARSEREDAAIPIAMEVRREAGFTEDELEDLKTLSGSGPTRDTMRSAAKIVRERHLAARAGQVSRSEPKASEDHRVGS